MGVVIDFAGQCVREELIDAGEKGGEGLSRTGRCDTHRISTTLKHRPGLLLLLSRLTGRGAKPVLNKGMKTCERHGVVLHHTMADDSMPPGPRCLQASTRNRSRSAYGFPGIAIPVGPAPAPKGEPVIAVSAPVVGLMAKVEMLPLP